HLSFEEQKKWVSKMLGYDFEILYKKGKENVVTDALSQKDDSTAVLFCAISILQEDWIDEARSEWRNDPTAQNLIHNLKNDLSMFEKI
ncbi:hypothetical protein KI387_027192, partial [Taxus chinensis]